MIYVAVALIIAVVGWWTWSGRTAAVADERAQDALEERVMLKAVTLRERHDLLRDALATLVARHHGTSEGVGNWDAALDSADKALAATAGPLLPDAEPPRVKRRPVDPGKQALAMLQAGDDCDWYSIRRTGEQHEDFDCLEIYWRTRVEKPTESGWGRLFEERAGFRVRWHVAATNTSYVEAYGLDLMETILAARAEADQRVVRAQQTEDMGHVHPALEAWKAAGEDRRYGFDGLKLDKWNVRLDFPGGLCWAEHADLEQAIADALAKANAALNAGAS